MLLGLNKSFFSYIFTGDTLKKIIIVLLILFPLKIHAYTPSASSYTIMDMDTKRILKESNGNEQRLIASTTKIMTALVTLNNAKLDNVIKVSSEVLKSYGSGIYIEVGESIKIRDLLYGLMLRSGNDAAIELAVNVGGSIDGFVSLMNETAKSIGMKNTTFINPHGLENSEGIGNMSTSNDMALLSSVASLNKTYKGIVSTTKHTVKTDRKTYIWYNKNKLLTAYEYATGGKTGFTKKARRTLVTTASKNNMNITVVTLNDPNDFKDHKELYESIFSNYKKYQVLNTKKRILNNEDYYIKNDFYMTLTKDEYQRIETNIIMYEDSVSKVVGKYEVKLNDKVYHTENIYKKEKKENKQTDLKWYQKIFRWLGVNNG